MSEMLTKEYDNPMCRQAMSLPELIRSQYEDLEVKTRKVLSFQEIFNIQRVVLTGCGDSYAACMATKHVFEMLTGIQAEVVTAIDFGRYYSERHMGVDCQNPLVIAVSNSGRVARISEAVQRAKFHDCFVLGITGNLTSPLAQNSDKVLKLDIPPFESAPGTRSYMVSVMALLLLACRSPPACGYLHPSNSHRNESPHRGPAPPASHRNCIQYRPPPGPHTHSIRSAAYHL